MSRPPPTTVLVEGRYRITTHPAAVPWILPDETCVDEKEGRPVLARLHRPRGASHFVEQEQLETAARLARDIESPWLLPVVLTSPRVIYAAPPEERRPKTPLPVPEAIACLLMLCDVMAKAHAAGIVGIGVEAQDVRVHPEEGEHRVTVILPHLPSPGRRSLAEWSPAPFDPVRRDLCMAAFFFRDLVTGHDPEPLLWSPEERPPWPRVLPEELGGVVKALLTEEPRIEGVPDVASLAEIACRGLPPGTDWPSRVASLPRVSSVKPVIRWDRRIELGQAELRAVRRREDVLYTVYPLAASYHQRALVHHGRGNLDSADRDLERALSMDRFSRYLVTRGLWRAARGDLDGSYSDYEEAVRLADLTRPPSEWSDEQRSLWIPPLRYDVARAHLARGAARKRRGDLSGAHEDFKLAVTAIEAEEEHQKKWRVAAPPSFPTLAEACRRALTATLKVTQSCYFVAGVSRSSM